LVPVDRQFLPATSVLRLDNGPEEQFSSTFPIVRNEPVHLVVLISTIVRADADVEQEREAVVLNRAKQPGLTATKVD
jgi:hypothetical protein